VTHIHFSFGWAGAEKRTSYWTDKVSPVLPPDFPVFARGHRSVTVHARSGTASPVWQLKGGNRYEVTAHGVWHHSKAKHGLADARCVRTKQGWSPLASGGVSIRFSKPTAAAMQWHPTIDTGHGCNSKTHTYRLVLSPHQNARPTVVLPDGKRSNDSGAVTLRFVR
jgi:hypothetical protein